MIIFAEKKTIMVVSTLLISMFLFYGCLAIYSIGKSVSGCGTHSNDRSKQNTVRDIELRNGNFLGHLLFAHAQFDDRTGMYSATVSGAPLKEKDNIDLSSQSKEELEKMIDNAYINIMNRFEEITGHKHWEMDENGYIHTWIDGEMVVTGRI